LAKARWFQEGDRPAVVAAMHKYRERWIASGREFTADITADLQATVDQMLDDFAVVIIGDYMVVFQIATSWLFPGAKFFEECLVMRIRHEQGTSLRAVVREMERLARVNGCTCIQVGVFGACGRDQFDR